MRSARFPGCRIYPVLLALAATGCQLLHHDEPIAVMIRDAETKKPIPGAEVRLSHLAETITHAPETTGADGLARFRTASATASDLIVEASAAGYLAETKCLADDARPATSPTSERVLELYAGPRPSVELVLPAGYHGPVRAEVQVHDDPAASPGQRSFRYAVPANGVVVVAGPAVFAHLLPRDFTARYADGRPLNLNPKDAEDGFRWVKSGSKTEYFLVGTKGECDEYRQTLDPESPPPPSGGGGKHGKGQGRHGGGRGRH